ncbi:hypothetical protein PRZ48_004363 [Zasmidium cellare]|uniref:non-specific serine/threonine protein kinase n=1 Tax=Zasmidium cellare TaxID=395010 RepID=A0ABR0EQH1_ZASCE|nr:hypothetical protein PRZ48_004363 [Zasmidium cellare]
MVNRRLTRQLFVEYERKSRGKTPAVQRQILREWTGKTAGQKDRLAKRLQRALDCDAVAEVHGHYAAQKFQAANAQHPTPYHDYFLAQDAAIEAQQQHRKAIEEVIEAYEALHREQRAQHADPQSLAFTQRAFAAGNMYALPPINPRIDQLERQMDQMAVPHHPAGVRKMPVAWQSKKFYARKHLQRITQDRSFRRLGTASQGGTWSPWRGFSGGMSTSALWIQFDANNTVIDRTVRKDVLWEEHWFDARFWAGQASNEDTREPLELACHGEMATITNTVVQPYNPLTAQLIHDLVSRNTRSYRLYTAYCEHNDLKEIIRHYRSVGQPIPEPFIWSVAEALMECALAMELGHTNVLNTNPTTANRQQIVHRDLKPTNVFLTAPNPAHFPAYPQAKVGDFGLAIQTSQTDPNNPHWYQGAGTWGYWAPENGAFVNQVTLAPLGPRMLACTNVWGVGMVLYSLIKRQFDPPQPGWLGDPTIEMMYHPAHNPEYTAYSAELIAVLRACLTIDTATRPGPAQVLTQIRAAWAANGPMTEMGMMNGTASVALQQVNALTYAPDQYALGMLRQNLPARTI